MTQLIPTVGITETQSITWVLREIFLNATAALPFFAGFTIKRNRRVPIQVADLPVLGVYLIDETMTPDGDANHDVIRFLHTFRIGFSVVILNNDDAASEAKLDQAFWAIMNGLWRNEYVMSRLDTRNPHDGTMNPDNVRFEAVVRGTRKHVWGNAQGTNEAPVAEMQYDVSITHRYDYPAIVNDTLNTISVNGYPSETVVDPASVQNVEVEYDFPPTLTPDPPWPPPWPQSGGNQDGTATGQTAQFRNAAGRQQRPVASALRHYWKANAAKEHATGAPRSDPQKQ